MATKLRSILIFVAAYVVTWSAVMLLTSVAQFLLLVSLLALLAVAVYHGIDVVSAASGVPGAILTVVRYSLTCVNRLSGPFLLLAAIGSRLSSNRPQSSDLPRRRARVVSVVVAGAYAAVVALVAFNDMGVRGEYYSTASEDDGGRIIPGVAAFLVTPMLMYRLFGKYLPAAGHPSAAKSVENTWPPAPTAGPSP